MFRTNQQYFTVSKSAESNILIDILPNILVHIARQVPLHTALKHLLNCGWGRIMGVVSSVKQKSWLRYCIQWTCDHICRLYLGKCNCDNGDLHFALFFVIVPNSVAEECHCSVAGISWNNCAFCLWFPWSLHTSGYYMSCYSSQVSFILTMWSVCHPEINPIMTALTTSFTSATSERLIIAANTHI